jgi:Rrf2 family protein
MAAVNTQFSIATHLMTTLGERGAQVTCSQDLADSINANASFIRRVLSRLVKAGLVESHSGNGGSCRLAKSPKNISLLDIYHAVEAPKVFAIHAYAENQECLVSCHIKSSMELVLDKVQASFEASLNDVALSEVMKDVESR